MYVCVCHGVTDRAIREAAASGVRDVAGLAIETGLGTGCGSCTDLAQELLDAEQPCFTLPVLKAA
ncbi:MAG: (2Fe-2S)-binding protein [Xanthomonadales bacterium]|nr:(2Fe-2S)-binding protein [Xanthomonadales bacterium]